MGSADQDQPIRPGQSLPGKLDLKAALRSRNEDILMRRKGEADRPHRVEVDNMSSSFFTILEVFSRNSPGLLYHITDAIFRCGLDIWVAKISTKVDQSDFCIGCEPVPDMDWPWRDYGIDGVFSGHAHWAERFEHRGVMHWTVGNTTDDLDDIGFPVDVAPPRRHTTPSGLTVRGVPISSMIRVLRSPAERRR